MMGLFRWLRTASITVLLVLPCASAIAGTEPMIFYGKVVGIADGDTVTVLEEGKTEHKVRLSGIDAPEKKQPFGQSSKEFLSRQVFGKDVEVRWNKKDRYGRIVGKLIVGGRDVCLEQIRRGLAWHYTKYKNEQPERDRVEYARSQEDARATKLGLWSEKDPIPPWDWRKASRK